MDKDENPCLIYEAEDGGDPGDISHVPLVLIHDGGGTCFAYYCLDPLGRPTYEIHNPHFYSGKSWAGGIPDMARHYVGLLRKAVPRGRILLGGWSLGGILSLEMARLLADDPLYNVLGIVMVDSICPLAFRAEAGAPLDTKRLVPFQGQFGPHTQPETIERVTRCFDDARKAVAAYQPPRWEGDRKEDSGREQHHHRLNGTVKDEGRRFLRNNGAVPKLGCPPAILLRATQAVPVEPEQVSLVDTVRNDRTLGWDEYRKGFFKEIVDIPGHHFNIFAFENIDEITTKLTEACNKLETLAHQTKLVSYQ